MYVTRVGLILAAALVVFGPLQARSEDAVKSASTTSTQSNDDQGSFRVAPYVWATALNGDIGGFDANSKLTWQAFAALGYDATESTRVLVGYRALGYDHDRDGFLYDTVMHGPIIGAGVGF
jgi:hypothetical protein